MRTSVLIALLSVMAGGRVVAAGTATTTDPPPEVAGAPPAVQPAVQAAIQPAIQPAIQLNAGTAPDPNEATAPDPKKRFPRIKPPALDHRDQFGLSLLPGTGYRVIAPYKDGIPCGQQNTRVCSGRLPFFLEVQPSFGFGRHWDLIVDLRFGVEADFSQSHEFSVAPGFRYWVDPELPAKFFATLQGVYDLNPQHDPGVKDYDFGVRNANGFMLEVMRNLGFYLQFGETLGLVRWLRFEVDGGIGIQARFP